jgi:hypothetical protein
MGQLMNTRRSDGDPDPDVVLKDVTRIMYDEFIRLLFLHGHRETSVLVNELPEESDQCLFLRTSCFPNLKGAVGFRSCRPTPFLDPSLVLFPPCSA